MGTTLVTGATGFLGAHVVAAAFTRSQLEATFADPLGPPVVAVGRRPELAPRFTDPRDGAEWIAADLLEDGRVDALFEELRPDQVIHCAAMSRVGDCEADPDGARRVHVELSGELARRCADAGARMVHVSTDLVFGASDAPEGGFDEDAEPGPLSVYGRTKADAELAVLGACPTAVVARLPLLYGNSAGRGLGASDSLLEAVDRDATPPLFVDEWRTPLEVSNAAEALVELADSDVAGRLHVAGPDRVSRHQFGVAVLRAMGIADGDAHSMVRATLRSDVETTGARPGDVSLDSSRARRLLETELLGVRAGTRRATE